MILFAKSYIRNSKISSLKIDFYDFQVKLKNRFIIEECIAQMNNKKDVFDKKWNGILHSL